MDNRHITRRKFLATTGQLTACLTLLPIDTVFGRKAALEPLCFFHTHTHERFELCTPANTCPPELKYELYSFLRDFRTGEIHPIDFRLISMLQSIQRITGSKGTYEVISAYRSPKTNESLRSKSTGVAKKSLHLVGKAIDVRLSDIPTHTLRDVAKSLKAGGVGYYAKSDFVHLDTGRVRSW